MGHFLRGRNFQGIQEVKGSIRELKERLLLLKYDSKPLNQTVVTLRTNGNAFQVTVD